MSVTSPLLGSNDIDTTPTPFAKALLSILGISRSLFGVGLLLAPSLALGPLGITGLSAEAAVVTRMFGVREITIGSTLLLAERSAASKRGIPVAHQAGREEVRRNIWLNVATDGMDLVFLACLFASGTVSGDVLARTAVGAVAMLVLGVETAWLYK
ncbi:hypothetical protein B0H67DRAFT_384904 [Lasiosphaeris hirsuta]|uniref:Uncharacterized protein n=1 Tax=Lasiosphaeris hirsuta TaxID=260670 RepID=A0AA40DJ33_9PEZI|nr:hypothetical protein B0H67DRAFT_384904 [Lasiosphaeris hirsuta]